MMVTRKKVVFVGSYLVLNDLSASYFTILITICYLS